MHFPAQLCHRSSALLLAELFSCPFAVKSGGHAAFAGSSSIQNGLNIDLSPLNISVGAGNRWVDVYNYLLQYNISVVGGRVSDIGVGGLTSGGGISFFSQIYGWACDNVVNYEVVLASGLVVNVNPNSYKDHYWALRGGGNNFGIVTRFALSTHSQGSLWSGSLVYTRQNRSTDQLIEAFYNYGINAVTDPKSALIFNWGYAEGTFLTLREVTDMFKESNPDGLRESFWTATFSLTQDMIFFMVSTFEEAAIRAANATSYTPALVLLIISTDVLTQMQKNSGNALGLASSDGN
ncbi:hypothetical protein V1505DRAFT_422869 [Lipomyces doorenjongii]